MQALRTAGYKNLSQVEALVSLKLTSQHPHNRQTPPQCIEGNGAISIIPRLSPGEVSDTLAFVPGYAKRLRALGEKVPCVDDISSQFGSVRKPRQGQSTARQTRVEGSDASDATLMA